MADLAFLDTNILIRYLTQDDPARAERAYALLQEVEQGNQQVTTAEAVIAEVVYVLSSKALYNVPRPIIAQRLGAILALSGLRLPTKGVYRRALDRYATTSLDFTDCLIVSRMEQAKITYLYSLDRDFDKISGITRIEP